MKKISSGLLEILPKDVVLDLRNNNISRVSDGYLLSFLHQRLTVDLTGNPIVCDCEMKYLGSLNMYHSKTLLLRGKCSTPARAKGRRLVDLRKNDFSRCSS
ncbi:Uncharacterised protein g9681 [Pycnogonum litorale]